MKNRGALTGILMSDAIAADEENVWILPLEKGVILRIEKKSGALFPCGVVPNPKKLRIPYRFLFIYENQLYLLPYEEDNILIFRIRDGSFERIGPAEGMNGGKNGCRFTSYVLAEDTAVITGESSKVLLLHLRTGGMRWIALDTAVDKKNIVDEWIWRYSYVSDGKLYFMPLTKPVLFAINLQSGEADCREIAAENSGCFDNPVMAGDILYYFNRGELGASLKEYKISTDERREHRTGICAGSAGLRAFGYTVYGNGRLWCFPGITDKGISYHGSDNRVEVLSDLPAVPAGELGGEYPYEFNYRNGFLTKDGHILLVHAWTEQLVDVDVHTGMVKVSKIVDQGGADWEEIYDEEFCETDNRAIREWKDGMLASFLAYIVSGRSGQEDSPF